MDSQVARCGLLGQLHNINSYKSDFLRASCKWLLPGNITSLLLIHSDIYIRNIHNDKDVLLHE